ncbi:MAG: corrinoid protein [Candidatus Bathyarchaeota archaeon]|nr:corrinoid protein [Candidatus Bathyarchaeota archaeon]
MSEIKKKRIFTQLAEAVVDGDMKTAEASAKEALAEGIPPYEAVTKGLAEGMKIVGEKYEQKEYFLPEMLLSSDAMYAGLNVLTPHIKSKGMQKGKVILGVVEGDIHDIGKNIVKTMLTAAGYEVVDLGKDVPADDFVKKAKAEGAHVIAMSTLMTPTLMSMKTVEEKLKSEGMKDKVKTIIGGGSVSEDWKSTIGSDAFGKDAVEAVDKIKLLIQTIIAAADAMKKNE